MSQKIKRKIPATMVTQHPDHAAKPYWHDKPFIGVQHETHECFLSFSALGASEYKWDWEGKLVDESVIERLLSQHNDYFSKKMLGKDHFLTFRLPNPKVETEYRLGRAFMGIISAAGLAKFAGFPTPLFEVILPMTESAEEMIAVQQAFAEIVSLKHPLLKHEFSALRHLELIPLFEKIDIISNSDKTLETYLKLHKKAFGFTPDYLRPYVARSDPALNSGIVPTVLSIKIALSKYKEFEKKHDIKLFPVIGAGSLPFRGGLTPHSIKEFMDEYKGIKTTTIQSAFRYDYAREDAIKAISLLESALQKSQPRSVSQPEVRMLRALMDIFEKQYKEVIEGIAPVINRVAQYVPKRRERVLHIGLFGYSRGEGKVKLPRAITFTAALYSLGIPPELIGTGRGLATAQKLGQLPVLEKHYINLKKDLVRAGRYLNKKNLLSLSKTSPFWQMIRQDVRSIERFLSETLGPSSDADTEHEKITAAIFANLTTGDALPILIEQAALLRHSMG